MSDVTVGDVLNINNALQLTGRLSKLDAKLSYRLAHNRRVSDEVRKIYDFRQREVEDELAERDEDGNVIKTPVGNGFERVKYGKNQPEAERRIAALRAEAAPMEDFRHLEMKDVDAIVEAAGEDFPTTEVIYGLYPIIKEK